MIKALRSRVRSLLTLFLPTKPYSFDTAANYWKQVPMANYRVDSKELVQKGDAAVLKEWEAGLKDYQKGWEERGYLPFLRQFQERFRDRTLAEIGCGLGFEHLTFFSPVCKQNFLCDIVPSNVAVVNTVIKARKLSNSQGIVIDYGNKPALPPLDFIYSHGVLHHIPFEICKNVTVPLFASFLRPKGRFIIMMYTHEFYKQVKALSNKDFARKTEANVPGSENPWSEPYDREKIEKLFGSDFEVMNEVKYNNDCFVLFEIEKRR